MTPKIEYKTESYTTDIGGTNIKIWVSEYENIDPNIFVLKEEFDMFHVPRTPTFHTIATPELLCEYPVDEPEIEGGFYRTDHIYLSFNKQNNLKQFLEDLDRRIAKLCNNIIFLNTPNNYRSESVLTKYGELRLEYTTDKRLSNCIKIILPENEKRLLVKNTSNLGTLFLDVCTPEDMLVYSENASNVQYRTNSVSLCCAYEPLIMLKNKIITLLKP